MDDLLARFGTQAATIATTFALRSSLNIAGNYAIKQVSRFIVDASSNKDQRSLTRLKARLDQKIKIITPAIDLIEIISARGNTSLDNTMQLTNALRSDIGGFARRVGDMTDVLEVSANSRSLKSRTGASSKEIKELTEKVLAEMEELLHRIEDAVPLISLALTTSGVSLSSSLPDNVSPSRLLQASAFLREGDSRYNAMRTSSAEIVIGPEFYFTMYTIFSGSSRINNPESNTATDISWKEEYPKCRVRLLRVPSASDISLLKLENGFNYELEVAEDLDDGRYHEESPGHPKGSNSIGEIKRYPGTLIRRLFFSASGRLLNIEDAKTPVLVLKLMHALPTDEKLAAEDYAEEENVAQEGEVEWIAFESRKEDALNDREDDSDDSDELDASGEETEENSGSDGDDHDNDEHESFEADKAQDASDTGSNESGEQNIIVSRRRINALRARNGPKFDDETPCKTLVQEFKNLNVDSNPDYAATLLTPEMKSIAPSLSLLEYLIRLSACQMALQSSILSIPDEQINLFLRDENEFAKALNEDLEASTRSRYDPHQLSSDVSQRTRRRDSGAMRSFGSPGITSSPLARLS